MEREDKIRQLRELVADDPADALTWFMLGGELLHAGEPLEAAEALRRAVEIAPDHTASWRRLGDAWLAADRRAEAEAAYRSAIETAERTGDLQVAKEARALLKLLEKESG